MIIVGGHFHPDEGAVSIRGNIPMCLGSDGHRALRGWILVQLARKKHVSLGCFTQIPFDKILDLYIVFDIDNFLSAACRT